MKKWRYDVGNVNMANCHETSGVSGDWQLAEPCRENVGCFKTWLRITDKLVMVSKPAASKQLPVLNSLTGQYNYLPLYFVFEPKNCTN